VAVLLASLQADLVPDEAIVTLRRARQANPGNTLVASSLAKLLMRNHQDSEAAAIATKILDTAPTDPMTLNSAAYALAQTGGDMALAERSSRKSLEMLNSETSPTAGNEASQQTLQRSSLLVASWDTLGYILLKQGEFDEAKDYLEAAWNNTPGSSEVGLHYGLLLEAQGKKLEALHVLQLSSRSIVKLGTDPVVQQAIEDAIVRLRNAGVKSSAVKNTGSALQDLRTFVLTLPSPANAFWSATYRLQFSAAGGRELTQVSGSPKPQLDGMIKELNLPRLVPNSSKTRLVRSAVVSCSGASITCTLVFIPLGATEQPLRQ
jgi:tetratricopeptide (TPR) repeat protein